MSGLALSPGQEFAGYVIEHQLGRGGMGVVYLAHHPHLPKLTVLKLLSLGTAGDDAEQADFRTRFLLEADHVAKLDHPNIVTIYDRGSVDGQMWIAMQYIDGSDVDKAVRSGPLDVSRSLHIVDDIAHALDYAHSEGVVHRDVKPANILLTATTGGRAERAVLTDFGIAKALDATRRLTTAGKWVGSLAYLAPEQVDPDIEPDGRVDVYSLGCTLFQLLTGTLPYPGTTVAQLIHGHLNSPIPHPSELVTQVELPGAIDDVIECAMAKDREERFASCGQLAAAAREALGEIVSDEGWGVPAAAIDSSGPRTSVRIASDAGLRSAHSPELEATTLTANDGVDVRALDVPGAELLPPIRRWRRRFSVVTGGLGVATAVAVGVVLTIRPAAEPAPGALPLGTVLPRSITTSLTGDVYVADVEQNSIVELPHNGSVQTVSSLNHLNQPLGVAVGPAGDIYVADSGNERVVELPFGANTETTVPLNGLFAPSAVAVDAVGNLYVTDYVGKSVVRRDAVSGAQSTLPFPGIVQPSAVAVDEAGTVYVTDAATNNVFKLPQGAAQAVRLPFTGLDQPMGLTVDAAGNLYVADLNRVYRLGLGSTTPTVVPVQGLTTVYAIAIDATSGDLLVGDGHRVLRVPAAELGG